MMDLMSNIYHLILGKKSHKVVTTSTNMDPGLYLAARFGYGNLIVLH